MKFKAKKLGILLVLGLVFPLIINNTINFSVDQRTNLKNPKPSNGLTFIHVDGSVANNWSDTASLYDWCHFDNGYYIIENVTIDVISSPTGSGILINNSKNEYFIIRNCTIFNADSVFPDSGIRLENTNNGTIINNNCSDNILGIYLINCEGNNITENTANNNEYNGIYLETNCVNNNITGNTADNNNYGIQLSIDCDYNSINLNTVTNNDDSGIFINSFKTPCDNNIIFNNTIIENNKYGISFRENTIANNENSIINNSVNDNIGQGIYLYNCHDINITGNYIYNNLRGIEVSSCDNSIITGNTINSNLEIGINLYSNSDSNEIKNNTINRNDLGIALDQSDFNNITGNTLKDNNWCIFETDCVGNIIEYNNCTFPTVEFPIFIDDSLTGIGAHNWTWAENQTWCSGTGTALDPYIIENLKISGFGIIYYGIDIRNSNVSFIIRECLIYNSYGGGIYLDNVNNSRLINNNCSNNRNGIDLEHSNHITIFENIVNENDNDGISLHDCDYINITGNTANNNDEGISITEFSDNNVIEGNTANNNDEGISIIEFSDNNVIKGNTLNGNGQKGIYIRESNNNKISGNTANSNYDGIYLHSSCYSNPISGNTANDNDRAGIYLSDSNYNNITENTASGNMDGIFLEGENNNNSITGNIFNNNQYGIEIYYSNFNDIIGNAASDNSYYGIQLEESNNNTISGNNVNNNTNYGIKLVEQSNNNTISGNKVNNSNDTGISINDNGDYNDITENILFNNTLGLSFYLNCDNNLIYQNFFLENGNHAVDDGTDNKWNSTTIGNYWDNHTGPDVSPQDGIVDTPYTHIGGAAGSIDYLPIAEDGAPIIIINSPIDGERFGSLAPTFNVEIIDISIFEMWYTLDGGLNNYTFTENGTISQSAWDNIPEGSVTIRFYANDTLGNLAFEEVTITKTIPSGGIDPTIIIVIVVVSVVGGVVVIAGVYIFMKRRVTAE